MKWTLSRTQKSVAVGVAVLLLTGIVSLVLNTQKSGYSWGGSFFSLRSPVIGPGDSDSEAEKATPSTQTTVTEGDPAAYGAAVNAHTGRRFQFVGCNGTPGTMVITAGTTVLLDNRDDSPISVQIGTTTYQLGAFGYAVAPIAQTGNLSVMCNGAGAATLTVQP